MYLDRITMGGACESTGVRRPKRSHSWYDGVSDKCLLTKSKATEFRATRPAKMCGIRTQEKNVVIMAAASWLKLREKGTA